MAQQNPPSHASHPSIRTHTVNRQPWGYGEESTQSKAKIIFSNLLAFHVSSPQKNKFSLLNPTNNFNIIMPVGFFLSRGFFPQKKHLFKNICNTRRATGCLSIFTTTAHFEDKSFFSYRNTIFYWKPLALGFVIRSQLFACSMRGNTITEISPSCRNTMLCCC